MRAHIRAMTRRHADGRPLDRHSVASFFVSRVDTEVDKRLAALGSEELAGQGRPRQRPRRLPGVQARLRRRGVRRAARRRLPRPAPALGLDRREEPGLPGDAVRRRPRRPRHGEHDAAADAAGRGRAVRGGGPDRRDRPGHGPRRAARRGHRPRRRHRQAAARRHRGLRRADEQAARRHRGQARGDRHRPPADVRGRPAARRSSSRSPSGSAKAAEEDVVHRLWRKDGTLWAPPGTPELEDRLGWLDDRGQAARGPDVDRGASPTEVRGDGHHRRRAARHGRLEPRPRGLPALVRPAGGRADAARARLDRAAHGPARHRRDRPGDRALHRLLEVGRDDRAERAARALPRAAARPVALRRRSPIRARR